MSSLLGSARAFFALAAAFLLVAGCSTKPTFPADEVPQAIEKISKDLYGYDVKARVEGGTVGVLLYRDRIINESGMIDQDLIRKTIGDMVLTITRVALSTDLPLEYVVVVLRGHEDLNEIRISRSVEDIKKAQTEALSIEESLNRTMWEQLKFPSSGETSDFPLENITLESFLAKQIVQRVRFAAPPKKDAEMMLPTELLDGKFIEQPHRTFEFSIVSFEAAKPELNVLKILKMVVDVLNGYRFDNFDQIVIKDLLTRKMLVIDKSTFALYRQKKIKDEEVLRLGFKDDFSESDRLRNALEIFGFNFQ